MGDLFSNPDDEELVLNKYNEVWSQVSECEALAYRRVGWGKQEALQLASILPDFTRMKSIVLTGSAIGSEGLLAIFRRVPPTVEAVTISESAGEDAADAVAAELPRLTKLRELDLSGCDFGDDGIEALVRCMPASVEHLEFRECGLKERGAMAITQLMPRLRKLHFVGNDLRGKGADAFVAALSGSPIEVLNLARTHLSDEEKDRLRCAWAASQKPEHSLRF